MVHMHTYTEAKHSHTLKKIFKKEIRDLLMKTEAGFEKQVKCYGARAAA